MRRLFVPVAFSLAALALTGCPDAETKDDHTLGEAQILAVEVTENSEVEKFDLSGDGSPDVWKYYSLVGEAKMRVKARTDRDLNFDGTIDSRQSYDKDGVMVKEEHDLDFDGRFDAIDTFIDGKLHKRSLAFNFEQKPTIWKYYENDAIIRKERDSNGDGKPDIFEIWEKGSLLRIGYDRNGDEKPDFYEEAAGAEKAK